MNDSEQPRQRNPSSINDQILRNLHHLERGQHQIIEKLEILMASQEDVAAVLTQLQTDIEALAAAALAEFEKLEQELSEKGVEAVDLTPLKEQVESIDAKVKEAKVPTG